MKCVFRLRLLIAPLKPLKTPLYIRYYAANTNIMHYIYILYTGSSDISLCEALRHRGSQHDLK